MDRRNAVVTGEATFIMARVWNARSTFCFREHGAAWMLLYCRMAYLTALA
jgi:hypothetical protein